MKSGVEQPDVTSLRTLISFRSSGSEKTPMLNRKWWITVNGVGEIDRKNLFHLKMSVRAEPDHCRFFALMYPTTSPSHSNGVIQTMFLRVVFRF